MHARRLLPLLLAACSGDVTDAAPAPGGDPPVAGDSDPVVVDSDPPTAPTDPPETDPPVDPPDTDAPDTDPGPPPTPSACFGPIWGPIPPVDYDALAPVMGRHCKGTNHQDISGVERVVFIGDSVTLGTPPTLVHDWYRNRLAAELAARWSLTPPGIAWRNVDLFSGVMLERFSGDFASCAKYGARTDDLLLPPHRQLETCLPESDRHLRTLVIMTIGGNDIFSLLEDVKEGEDEATLRATYDLALERLEDAIRWVVEPGRFPNGVFVVFGNTFDFTDPDGAEDMASCPGAQLIGLSEPLRDPVFQDIMARAAERYLALAVETGTDLFFLGEAFCGHGHNADDPQRRCYRGPGTPTWYDLTCEHPNALGHAALADLVLAVIDE